MSPSPVSLYSVGTGLPPRGLQTGDRPALRVEAVALRWAQVTSVDVRIWLLPGQSTRVSLEDAVSGQREGTVEP